MGCNKRRIQEDNGTPHNFFPLKKKKKQNKKTRLKEPCLSTSDDNEVQDPLIKTMIAKGEENKKGFKI